MKKLMLLLCLLVATSLQAHMILKGKITQAKAGEMVRVNVPFDNWYYKQNSQETLLNQNGEFTFNLSVTKPQTIFLDYAGQRLLLYAEPNKQLLLGANASNLAASIKFKGELAAENNFRKETGLTFYKLYPQTWNDSLSTPQQILAAIEQSQQLALEKLQRAKLKNLNFIRQTRADINYYAPSKTMDLIFKNNVWSTGHTPKFPQHEWREALKRAYAQQPLSNSAAIGSYHYQQTVTYYRRYLDWSASSKEEVAKVVEAIYNKPFAAAYKEVREKGERFWEYTILHYGLQGAPLEHAIASFINHGIYSGDLGYLQEAYTDFDQRFPNSTYRSYLKQIMQPYFRSQAKSEISGIELDAAANAYKTLEPIVAAHRGRVVYVDVWGSWCGPCREEFAYTKVLKERFAGKQVDFVYIAFEKGAKPEKNWKEAIYFYNLAGRHILGNKDLESYFHNLYKQEGALVFPSYLLIDKSGKIVTQQAERPAAGEKLYHQIENMLK